MPTRGQWSCPNCRGLLAGAWQPGNLLALAGLGMILIGIGFKLALVPFHFWAADVYEGAPAPVTALIATASKGAVFALLFRYFGAMGVQMREPFFVIFTVVAIASMFLGNYLALLQNNLKRLLAYSSIAHMGYLLVAFLAGGRLAVTAVTFYLVAYFITTLGAFGVITALSNKETDFSSLAGYRGLALGPSVSGHDPGGDDVLAGRDSPDGGVSRQILRAVCGRAVGPVAVGSRARRQQRGRAVLLFAGRHHAVPAGPSAPGRSRRPPGGTNLLLPLPLSAGSSWPCLRCA